MALNSCIDMWNYRTSEGEFIIISFLLIKKVSLCRNGKNCSGNFKGSKFLSSKKPVYFVGDPFGGSSVLDVAVHNSTIVRLNIS